MTVDASPVAVGSVLSHIKADESEKNILPPEPYQGQNGITHWENGKNYQSFFEFTSNINILMAGS